VSPPPATLLAFDYGARKIGVAVGQTVTGTASPLGSIAVRGGAPDWDAVVSLVRTWRPDALVVGLPLNMDGTEQDTTRRARRFARQLRERFSLQVHLVDERLSTREARQRLAARGRTDADDDPVAAQIILEDWLGTVEEGT
jgi:putative Holliday junction resolvase